MAQDDVLFGCRQQFFAEAARTNVSEACRRFGVHRSAYYAWRHQVERHGLEVLRPRERRAPKMPNQFPTMVEERIVSFAIAHPGLGPKRVASGLRREKWGGILDECWRPAFAHYMQPRLSGLRRGLDTYRRLYDHDRVHHGRLTRGRIPAHIVYDARKTEVR